MRNGSECKPVRRQLARLVDGELSPEAAERLANHLKCCPACARERRALAALQSAYRGLPGVPVTTADRTAIVQAARARGSASAAPRPWGRIRIRLPEVVTACAAVASLLLALSLRGAGRRARAAVLPSASSSVLTLVEYRATIEGRAIDAHARFSSGPPQ
jgi:anti-sigma factor RsiW